VAASAAAGAANVMIAALRMKSRRTSTDRRVEAARRFYSGGSRLD
jgi:hypothetical protein